MPEKKTLLDCYLDTGMPGHLAMLVFIVALVFAWVIFRQRRGLRYRMAFLAIAFIPLMSGITGCCYGYAVLGTPVIQDDGTIVEWPLQVLVMGSVQTLILMVVAAVLLVQREDLRA